MTAARRTKETRNPEEPAPTLLCPDCDSPLTYLHTKYGVLFPTERWDSFDCLHCHATFEYWHRTRKLRKC